MIIKRQNMSENKWNHFKIVPQGHNNCQLSIVNCQFGEAAKFQFIVLLQYTNKHNLLSPSSPLSRPGDFFALALAARPFDCFIFRDVVEFFHGDSLSSLPAGASPVNV